MRIIEFVLLFGALPTLFAFTRHRIPAIPGLWLFAVFCWALLWRDPSFDRSLLWRAGRLPESLPGILIPFAISATLLVVVIWRRVPGLLFRFPKSNPALWGVMMLLYPPLSVYPQNVIFRAFLFHRYSAVFGTGALMIIASAAAFGYVHIVFKNGWAVALSTLTGILFAWRYFETQSLFVSSFEHALYGCLVFTAGIGKYFLHRLPPKRG